VKAKVRQYARGCTCPILYLGDPYLMIGSSQSRDLPDLLLAQVDRRLGPGLAAPFLEQSPNAQRQGQRQQGPPLPRKSLQTGCLMAGGAAVAPLKYTSMR
jgi:hypothetical protein